MNLGDEDFMPDLASACHRAVTTLLSRYDLIEYSAIVSDIGHGYWMDARAMTEPSSHRRKRRRTCLPAKTK